MVDAVVVRVYRWCGCREWLCMMSGGVWWSCVGVGWRVLLACVREDGCGRTVGVAGFRSWEAGLVSVGVGCVSYCLFRCGCVLRATVHRVVVIVWLPRILHGGSPVRSGALGGVWWPCWCCCVRRMCGWLAGGGLVWSAGWLAGWLVGWRCGWLCGWWLWRGRMVGLFFLFLLLFLCSCGGFVVVFAVVCCVSVFFGCGWWVFPVMACVHWCCWMGCFCSCS